VRPAHLVLSACAAFAVTVPLLAGGATVARAAAAGPVGSGGAGIGAPRESPSTPAHPTVAGDVAKIIDGEAYAPSFAPPAVKEAIWAGDRIRQMPYVLGGGHGDWSSPGYDCSGSVSYVLHAAGLLRVSEDSGQLERWGVSGPGDWITVYTNAGHAFIQIAGIRLDTSAEQDPNPPSGTGPRWRPLMHGTRGFVARHPADY
jgi:cell wall-associated NlpC family hydrolase